MFETAKDDLVFEGTDDLREVLTVNPMFYSFVLDEQLMLSLLVSHLLFSVAYLQGFPTAIEDITFNKKTRKVTFKFKKVGSA